MIDQLREQKYEVKRAVTGSLWNNILVVCLMIPCLFTRWWSMEVLGQSVPQPNGTQIVSETYFSSQKGWLYRVKFCYKSHYVNASYQDEFCAESPELHKIFLDQGTENPRNLFPIGFFPSGGNTRPQPSFAGWGYLGLGQALTFATAAIVLILSGFIIASHSVLIKNFRARKFKAARTDIHQIPKRCLRCGNNALDYPKTSMYLNIALALVQLVQWAAQLGLVLTFLEKQKDDYATLNAFNRAENFSLDMTFMEGLPLSIAAFICCIFAIERSWRAQKILTDPWIPIDADGNKRFSRANLPASHGHGTTTRNPVLNPAAAPSASSASAKDTELPGVNPMARV